MLFNNTILQQSIFHLNPREFDAQIISSGTRGTLRHGLICPCQRIETSAPRINCPSCRGVGWLYPEGEACETYMRAGSRQAHAKLRAAGILKEGQEQAMALSGAQVMRGDLWQPCGEVQGVQQVIRHDQQQVNTNLLRDTIRRQSHTDTVKIPGPRVEKLLYPDVTSVEWVYYENADGVATRAIEGVDFQLVGREIRWAEGAGPPPGKAYTCRYWAPTSYLVEDMLPAWTEEGGQKLPWRVTLRRLDRIQEADIAQRAPQVLG
jgi:hypothetical protein